MNESNPGDTGVVHGGDNVVSKKPESASSGETPTTTTTDLGYLNQVSEICVKQIANVFEMTRGTEEPNKYVIVEKSTGEILYNVLEDFDGECMRQICCSNRSFTLRLVDKFNREIIKIIRPHLSCRWFCGLTDCYDAVEVWVRNYKSMRFDWRLIGQVRKFWCPLLPFFKVYDKDGSTQFTIRGPLITMGARTFNIRRSSETVGKIKKEWSGLCREVTTDYDLFSLQFPPNVDEQIKATLLGSLFLIDFKFYEGNGLGC